MNPVKTMATVFTSFVCLITQANADSLTLRTAPAYVSWGSGYACNVFNYSHSTVNVIVNIYTNHSKEVYDQKYAKLGPRSTTDFQFSSFFGGWGDDYHHEWGSISCEVTVTGKRTAIERVRAGLAFGEVDDWEYTLPPFLPVEGPQGFAPAK